MTEMEHFRVNGKIDFKAYREAQIRAGERCSECHRYTMPFPWQGYAGRCRECIRLLEAGEATHGCRVRCPHCRAVQDAFYSGAVREPFNENPKMTCDSCGETYTISVRVLYEFTSPALKEPRR